MKRALAFTLMVLAIMIIAVSCEEPQVHVHTYSDKWASDDTYHWHEATCGDTDEVGDKEAHKFGNLIPDVAATESTTGKGHRVCSVCGYKRNEEISALGHSHKLSSGYTPDATGHWQTCSGCNSKVNFSAHTISCVSADDLVHNYKCTVCGYVEKTETHDIAETTYSSSQKEQWCTKCSYKKTLAAVETRTEKVTSVTEADSTAEGESKISVIKNGKTVEKTVNNSDIVKNSQPFTITTNVAAVEDNKSSDSSTTTTPDTTSGTKVEFPVNGLKMEKGATEVTLTVKAVSAVEATSSNSGYQISTTTDEELSDDEKKKKVTTEEAVVAALEFDLKGAVASDLTGTKTEDGTTTENVGTTVTTYIAKGLWSDGSKTDVKNVIEIKYLGNSSGKDPEVVSYDNDSGELVFTIYHFSTYAVVAKDIVATDNEGNMYASLEGDNGAIAKVENDGTITLLKDVTLKEKIEVEEGRTVTIELNGKKIASSKENTSTVLKNNGVLTLKNGSLELYSVGGYGYSFMVNESDLSTQNVTINMSYKNSSAGEKSIYGVYNGYHNGDEFASLKMHGTTVKLEVKEGSVAVKPTAVYCNPNTESEIVESTIETKNVTAGSVYGFYILVHDQNGIENAKNATGTLENTKVTVSNSSTGSVAPVFAESKEKNAKAEITLKNCVISSTSTCNSGNSGKTVYGVRVKGPGYITLDKSTEDKITLTEGTSGSKTATFANEMQDHEVTAKNLYGTINTPSYVAVDDKGNRYGKLADAISKVTDNGTISLLKNVKLEDSLVIASDEEKKTLTLDLCGKTIKTDCSIANSGKLTIKNGTIKSTMTTDSWGVAFRNEHGAVLATSGLTLDITFTNGGDATGDLVGLYNVGEAVIENSKISVIANGGKSKVLGVYSNDGDAAGTTVRESEIKVDSSSEGSSYGFYMLLRSYPESKVTVNNSVESKLENTTVEVTQSTVGSVTPVFAESYEKDYTSTIYITGCTEISGTNTVESNMSGKDQKYVYAVRAKGNGVINIDSTSAEAKTCTVTSTDTAGAKSILEKEKLTINSTEVEGKINSNYSGN